MAANEINRRRTKNATASGPRYTGREGLNHWIREGLYGPPDAAATDVNVLPARKVLGDPDLRFVNRSPVPRVREADGVSLPPRPKTFHPTPEHKTLLQVYAGALEDIRAVLPLRAARLEDLMCRVDEALQRLQGLRMEEEHRKLKEMARLDSRRAELEVDAARLSRAIDEMHTHTEPLVQDRLEAWRRAREAAAWIYAAAGQDFPHAEDEELTDSLKFVAVPDALPESEGGPASSSQGIEHHAQASGAVPAAPSTTAPSIGKRLLGFIGLDRPMAGSEEAVEQQEAADLDESKAAADPARRRTSAGDPRHQPSLSDKTDTGQTLDSSISPAVSERHRTGEWMRRLIPKRILSTSANVSPQDSAYDAQRPPFDPVTEARRQVRNERAIAAELCLPYPSSAETSCDGKSHVVARWLAMVALGSIFGMSIGLIMELFSPALIAEEPAMQRMALLCVVLGICAFWGMGRLASMITAVAAEGLMNDAFADANTMYQKFRKQAVLAWRIAVCIIGALIVIEALVENQGIVGSLIKAGSEVSFATTPTAPTGIETLGVLLVCLVISGPFVLFHATEGWIEARAAAIQYRLKNIHEREVFERADQLRDAYDRAYPPFGGVPGAAHEELENDHARIVPVEFVAAGSDGVDYNPAPGPVMEQDAPSNGHSAPVAESEGMNSDEISLDAEGRFPSPLVNPVSVLPERAPQDHQHVHRLTPEPARDPSSEANGEAFVMPRVDGACELDPTLPDWSGSVEPMHVAVARERVFQTARRLQEARADQYEALLPLKARRAEIDVERLSLATDTESDLVAQHLLEDAYSDYMMATRLFDEEFRTLLDMVEQVTRRRAVRKWWKRLLRRMGGVKPEDMEAGITVSKVQPTETTAAG